MITNGWQKKKLGEIANVQTGPFGSQLHVSDYVEDGIPVIMPVNIENGNVNTTKIARVEQHKADSLARHKVSQNDIVFSRRGDVERHAFMKEEHNGWLCGTGCLKVAFKNGVHPRFVSYQLLLEEKKTWLRNHAVGTTMPNLNTSILSALEVELPSLEEQKRIASILSSIDEKIELSRQTAQTLEAIAQAIFKEWFVDFNFPGATGEMQESELGEIPKGWRTGTLGDQGEFKNGINYSREENGDTTYYIINVRDVVENKFISKSVLDTINVDKKKATPYLLKADDIVIVRSASPGETAILLHPEENIIYSGFTIRFRLTNRDYFLYFFLIFQNLKQQLDNLSNGTTLKNINQEMLKSYNVRIPEADIILRFNKIIKPLFDNIQTINEHTKTLAQLRDDLLPQLMKGEITMN